MRLLAVGFILSTGCVDAFTGSNVQIDFQPGTPPQASAYGMQLPGEAAAHSHYTLYAVDEYAIDDNTTGSRLFELQRFEIHPIVDLLSPCYIDRGAHVPYPGLHVSQYLTMVEMETGIADIANPPPTATEEQKNAVATAMQRMNNVNRLASETGVRVVTSASEGNYPNVAADCQGGDSEIPPPTCITPDANAKRLRLCQAAWDADPTYFEGTDRVLVAPLNGITNGFVDGLNDVAAVGGAQFFVDEALSSFDAYAIYLQADGMAGTGNLVLYGKPTMPTRGVQHVHLESPNSSFFADMAIFADLDEDEVKF